MIVATKESVHMPLTIKLKKRQLLIANGITIRCPASTVLELESDAPVLFGERVMMAEDATTPARRLYFAIQMAFIGRDDARERSMQDGQRLADELSSVAQSEHLCSIIDRAMVAAGTERFLEALELIRRVVRLEDHALGFEAREVEAGQTPVT